MNRLRDLTSSDFHEAFFSHATEYQRKSTKAKVLAVQVGRSVVIRGEDKASPVKVKQRNFNTNEEEVIESKTVEEEGCHQGGWIRVKEGDWVVFEDGAWLGYGESRFNGTFEEAEDE